MKSAEEEVSTRWYLVSGRVAQKCAPLAQNPQNLAQKCAPPFPAGPKMRPNVRPGRQIFNKTPLPTQKPTTAEKKLSPCQGGAPKGGGGLKSASAEGGFLISFLSAALKRWKNSEKTGEKAAIFGQKTEKKEQRVDKKGKETDKLGVRNNTYKTATKPRFQPKNPQKRSLQYFFKNNGRPTEPETTGRRQITLTIRKEQSMMDCACKHFGASVGSDGWTRPVMINLIREETVR